MLLGSTIDNKNLPPGNSDVATIYHELFHVFQSNAARSVFDYFYLVDRLQAQRAYLLRFLGKAGFFAAAGDEILENCLTVFHCADQTGISDLKALSDLSLSDVENLIKYFEDPKDTGIHAFEIIEGSAEVFGLCCGGFNAFAQLDLRSDRVEQSDLQIINHEMYLKAYKLFKGSGGQTPIVFLLVCLLSLKYGAIGYTSATPSDVFVWSLKNHRYGNVN